MRIAADIFFVLNKLAIPDIKNEEFIVKVNSSFLWQIID
jgi:hypothetical protein